MRQPVVLDLETKNTFRQFHDPGKLGISVAGLYDFKSKKTYAFFEKDINLIFAYLEAASYIIGFNIDEFDLPVLKPYYPGNIYQLRTFDILKDVKKNIGKSVSLNSIVMATLGRQKTGHGLQAIELYKEGRLEELKKYCLDDVILTKDVFVHGVENGEIFYRGVNGPSSVRVSWNKYIKDSKGSEVSLTLPF